MLADVVVEAEDLVQDDRRPGLPRRGQGWIRTFSVPGVTSCSSASRVRSSGKAPVTSGSVCTRPGRDQLDRVGPEADRAEHADQVDVAHDQPVEVERDRRRAGEAERDDGPAGPHGRERRGDRRGAAGAQDRDVDQVAVADASIAACSGASSGSSSAPAAEAERRGERQPVRAGVGDRPPTRRPRRGRTARRAARSARRRRRARAGPRPARGARRAAPPRSARPARRRAARARRGARTRPGRPSARPSRRPCGRSRSRCAARTGARGPARQRTHTPQPIATSPTTRSPAREPGHARADVDDLAGPLVARARSGTPRGPSGSRPASRRRSRRRCRRCRRAVGAISSSPSPGVGSGRSTSSSRSSPWNSIARMASARIEQPSKELRTADDGDGTRQGIASRRE